MGLKLVSLIVASISAALLANYEYLPLDQSKATDLQQDKHQMKYLQNESVRKFPRPIQNI